MGAALLLAGFDGAVASAAASERGSPDHAAVSTVDSSLVPSGYLEAASDGGVFAFSTPFSGSMAGHALSPRPAARVAFAEAR